MIVFYATKHDKSYKLLNVSDLDYQKKKRQFPINVNTLKNK